MAASSGNLVEWFDFYIYAFSAIYFAPAFFPKSDPTAQLLNTAGVFAAGFLMRPIGGWLFGRIADRRGRKTSLLISVVMMCGGSLLIASLPTYAQIGAWAPFLLLLPPGPGPVGRRRIRRHGHLHERGGDARPARLLLVVPVRHADRRPAAGRAGHRGAAAAAGRGRAEGLGLAHPVRHRRHHGGGRAVPAPHAARDLDRAEAAPARTPAASRAGAPPRRLPHGAGLHGRRLADLLHLHHLHAEVPGQHGRHVDQDGQQRDDGLPVPLHVHAAGVRRAVGPHRAAQQHAAVRRPGRAIATVPILTALGHVDSPVRPAC
jgi:hypothetical protein